MATSFYEIQWAEPSLYLITLPRRIRAALDANNTDLGKSGGPILLPRNFITSRKEWVRTEFSAL